MTIFKKNKNFDLGKINKPTMVVGLPGIGNVGKISIDFIIEYIGAVEVGKFYIDIPPMIFPSAGGAEFPAIKIYYAQQDGKDFLFLAGDYQPRDSKCFEFCTAVLDFFKEIGGREILVLGGAAFPNEITNPEIFYISSTEELSRKYSRNSRLTSADGNLGPIVGVAGVMVGLAKEYNINATTFLTEINDKEYFNLASIKASLNLVKEITNLEIDTTRFDLKIGDIKQVPAAVAKLDKIKQNLFRKKEKAVGKEKQMEKKGFLDKEAKETKEPKESKDAQPERVWYIG